MSMRLGAWAKQTGVSYKTAWRMPKAGTLISLHPSPLQKRLIEDGDGQN